MLGERTSKLGWGVEPVERAGHRYTLVVVPEKVSL